MQTVVNKNVHKTEQLYQTDEGLTVRRITLALGVRTPVRIGYATDLHFNYCNDRDFEENDPVLMSTYKNRQWLKNGASLPNARRCLEYISSTDQMILGGDILDYLSYGTMELMDKEIWDKYPGILSVVGGHELLRRCQGDVEDNLTYSERISIIEDYWRHDIHYYSKAIKESVMVVLMLNDHASFTKEQGERLLSDIDLARKNGYPILLFAHEPLRTFNPKEKSLPIESVLTLGDAGGFPINYFDGIIDGKLILGNDACSEETKEVLSIIRSNADVIRAVIVGHRHSNIYTEIIATTPDGAPAVIPQYICIGTPYDKGHVAEIVVE